MSEFITILKDETAEIIEKKSKFIANISYVENIEEAEAKIKDIKKKYHDAKHNCIAYRVMENGRIVEKASDDGEPSGTAGGPMLNILQKNNLCNLVVVVTRYFGGILLGAGGLTRAYTKGASIAIKSAGVVEKVKGLKISFEMEYDLFGKVQYICGQNLWHIEETEYADKVIVHILCEENMADAIEGEIVEASSGKVIVRRSEEGIYFKEEHRLYAEI